MIRLLLRKESLINFNLLFLLHLGLRVCTYNTCMGIKTSMGLSKVAYYLVEYLFFVRKSSTVIAAVTIATMSQLIEMSRVLLIVLMHPL